MATSDDALETYTHLPIQVDPASKHISVSSSDKTIQDAVAMVNNLHSQFKNLDTPNQVPPPPLPVNQKRTAQVQKLRETAAQHARKGQHTDAIRLLSLAIDMATSRPGWEPSGLAREELAICYLSRAAANMDAQNWVDGWKDAECSQECKRGPQTTPQGQRIPGNPKAFIVGAKCLQQMGRIDDAMLWVERGIEVEGREGDDGRELSRMEEDLKKRAER